jgi:hypothetical protein
MFEAAIDGQYPEKFPTVEAAKAYIADTPIIGVRPWVGDLNGPGVRWGFLIVSGRALQPRERQS